MRFTVLGHSATLFAASLLACVLITPPAGVRAEDIDVPLPKKPPPELPPLVLPATQPAATRAPATRPAETRPVEAAAVAATRPSIDPALIDPILAQLSNSDWKKREKALGELVRLGEDAVPSLQETDRNTQNDEVRNAVRTALKQIAENRLSGVSYITLHLKDVPARLAYESLSRQAFVPLKPFPDNLFDQPGMARVTIDMDHQPFWTAMRELSRQTNIDLNVINGQVRLSQSGGVTHHRAVVSGPFMIVANQITRSQTVDLEQDAAPVEEQFGIQFTAFAEPKLSVIHVSTALKIDVALDDKGNSLVAEPIPGGDAEGFGGPSFNSELGYSLFAALKYPKNAGSKIARLRASVFFTVQLESQKIEIKDLKSMKDTVRVVNGVRIAFNEFTRNGENCDLKVTLSSDASNAVAFQQMQRSIGTMLHVTDATGQALDQRGSSSNGQENKMELTLNFGTSHRMEDGRASGEPVKIMWEIPIKTRDIRVPFEFTDLKLP